MPAREPGLKGSVRAFGRSTPDSLASYDPATCSWRTSQLSLLEDLGECLETWPRSGMTRSGTAYRLRPLVPLIGGIASGSLPTPVANDQGRTPEAHMAMKRRMPGGERKTITSLAVLARNDFRQADGRVVLPTPTASEHKYRLQGNTQQSKGLGALAARGELEMWPTPTARDWKDTGDLSKVPPNGLLPRVVWRRERERESSMSGQLNPTWVEWLMGFLLGWTDLGPSATRSSRKSQSGSAAASKSGKRAAK